MPPIDPITRAARLIHDADALVIAAGAGMGVDSGLPDFRGSEGFWRAYPALRASGTRFESIACPTAFESSPAQAWGFYGHRLALYRRTVPHRGFSLLKQWGEQKQHGYSVFTSNVDGQFQRAGFDPARVHECHGSVLHLQCLQPCSDWIDTAEFDPEVDMDTCALLNTPPRCPHCGGLARPNVLMFNDWGWVEQRQRGQAARQAAWLSSIDRPVVIEIGAGTAIPSVRRFAEQLARDSGARMVRINPLDARVPKDSGVGLKMGALAALEAIDQALA
jgi:NAD-dependent SIR2 family protein deacetylase